MQNLADLLKVLRAQHAEFLDSRWDLLSADDAKRFNQIERDIAEVAELLGTSGVQTTPGLQQCIEPLRAQGNGRDRSQEHDPGDAGTMQPLSLIHI